MTDNVNGPLFPDVTVKLVGEDGNAFTILGKVRRALKDAGATQEQLNAFFQEATSGDYDRVLQTCMKYVNVK